MSRVARSYVHIGVEVDAAPRSGATHDGEVVARPRPAIALE